LSAQFKLESGFNSDLGTQANPTKLFNRYATVGLTDARLGTVTLGRMPDFAYDYVGPLTNSVPGISWSYSPGNLDNLANVYGIDNAVRYETPVYGGLQFGVMNGLGENADNFSRGRQYSIGFRYSGGPARLAGSYSQFHNRTADLKSVFGVASVLGQSLAAGPFNADRFGVIAIGGSYEIGMFTPHATWTSVDLENKVGSTLQRNAELGVNFDASGGKKATILSVSFAHSTFAGMAYNQVNLFATRYLSKSVQIYAGTAVQRASGAGAVAGVFGYAPSSTKSQALARTGVQFMF
jgi:predicted porin